jgi:hypothetical protein
MRWRTRNRSLSLPVAFPDPLPSFLLSRDFFFFWNKYCQETQDHHCWEATRGRTPFHGSKLLSFTGTQANPCCLLQFFWTFSMPIFLLSAFNQVPVLPFLDPLQVRFVAKSVLKDDLFHSQICSQIHVIHDKDFHVTQDSCFLTQTELAVLSSPMFSNSYVSLSVSF